MPKIKSIKVWNLDIINKDGSKRELCVRQDVEIVLGFNKPFRLLCYNNLTERIDPAEVGYLKFIPASKKI